MNATKTIRRAHQEKGKDDIAHWETQSAIDRICGRNSGAEAVFEVDGSEMCRERTDNFDYYVVNTDEFQGMASKGSVIKVWTGSEDVKLRMPGNVVLVAGNNRLELRKWSAVKGAQILGHVTKVEYWPGQVVRDW